VFYGLSTKSDVLLALVTFRLSGEIEISQPFILIGTTKSLDDRFYFGIHCD